MDNPKEKNLPIELFGKIGSSLERALIIDTSDILSDLIKDGKITVTESIDKKKVIIVNSIDTLKNKELFLELTKHCDLIAIDDIDTQEYTLSNPDKGNILPKRFKGLLVEDVRAEPKVGRNELCSCGSGLKNKKCCKK